MTKKEQELIDHVDAIIDATEELTIIREIAYSRGDEELSVKDLEALHKAYKKQRKTTRAIMKWFRH